MNKKSLNHFKTYKESLAFLFNLERAGIKYDLQNIKVLLKSLENPQNNFKAIHVAGTNGKGSVSSFLNSFLMEKGYVTGLYTSPHIKDFRERILINGKFVSKKYITEFVNTNFKTIELIKPSFFEVSTAMCFDYFSRRGVQYAIIETGLGGRLDSTNVITPVLSVITSISIDHTDFLGESIISITKEKGGIIKKNIPAVIGKVPRVSVKIFRDISKKKHSEIIFAEKVKEVKIIKRTEKGFYFNVKNKLNNLFFPVVGDYQVNNIKTFFASLNALKDSERIHDNLPVIKRSFKNLKSNSKFSGRFELISSNPKVVIDVSHNLQAIENIDGNLKYFKYNKLFIIFAMMEDKNYKECLNILGRIEAKIILTKPDYKRAANPSVLFEAVNSKKPNFMVKEKLKHAADFAFQNAGKKDLILVTGSFFLVSDFLKIFRKKSLE